ncbi:MAG: PH domain-containing protein [Scrofimicrobium sp.]
MDQLTEGKVTDSMPAEGSATDPLAPEGVEFKPVSSALAKVRLIGAAISLLIPAVILAVMAVTLTPYLWIVVAALLAVFLWLLWLIPRQVHALGYATTSSDLLVRRGIMFRRLDVVPFGRIQFVDVHEGPVARAVGIASCTLHTASASTDASIDGLPVAEANRLREQLVTAGAANLSGL